MEEGDDDEEDEEEEEGDEEDEDEEMEDIAEAVDPSVILPPGTRRSTRAKVDYSSKEAMEKAGIKSVEDDEAEHEDSFTMDKE